MFNYQNFDLYLHRDFFGKNKAKNQINKDISIWNSLEKSYS